MKNNTGVDVTIMTNRFEMIMIVDQYKSLVWVDRYDKPGEFELFVPMDVSKLQNIKIGYYAQIRDSRHTMIIEAIEITTDIDEGSYYIIRGRSAESLLDRRIIWGLVVLKGSLEANMEKIMNENFIKPEQTARKMREIGFQLSGNPEIEKLKVANQFTGDNLYDMINKLCVINKIGFNMFFEKNKFIFRLYKGKDRTYDQTENPYVIFSPDFDNLLNSEYRVNKQNLKTVTLVAGEGEGIQRKSAVVFSQKTTGINRRELFTDARDLQSTRDSVEIPEEEYIEILKERGREKLSEKKEKIEFEGEIDAFGGFKYGKDFFVGDIVQIKNQYGIEGKTFISEIVITSDVNGVSINPTFEMQIENENEEV